MTKGHDTVYSDAADTAVVEVKTECEVKCSIYRGDTIENDSGGERKMNVWTWSS